MKSKIRKGSFVWNEDKKSVVFKESKEGRFHINNTNNLRFSDESGQFNFKI